MEYFNGNGIYYCTVYNENITELIPKCIQVGRHYYIEVHDMANVSIFDPNKELCIAYMDVSRVQENFCDVSEHRNEIIEKIIE